MIPPLAAVDLLSLCFFINNDIIVVVFVEWVFFLILIVAIVVWLRLKEIVLRSFGFGFGFWVGGKMIIVLVDWNLLVLSLLL